MSAVRPAPLPENRDLAFVGEPVRREAVLPARSATVMLQARNEHGKPNADVMRRSLGADGRERWVIDFPADMDEREAALYARPFTHLRRKLGERPQFWRQLQRQPAMRTALARRIRYLATPRDRAPQFAWVEAEVLPDDSLLVVARDDDFALGVLSSRYFRLWWEKYHDPRAPEQIVLSFPFPWPAHDEGRLTRAMDEAKYALNRAARSGDPAAIDAATIQAYAWADPPAPGEELARLLELHRWRLENY